MAPSHTASDPDSAPRPKEDKAGIWIHGRPPHGGVIDLAGAKSAVVEDIRRRAGLPAPLE